MAKNSDGGMSAAKTWDEAIAAGKLGLAQIDGCTLDVEEIVFGETEFGEYAELTGKIIAGEHAATVFGHDENEPRLFVGKSYLVTKLQQQIRSVPFRVQFSLGTHPKDATKQMWHIGLLSFPKVAK